MIKIDTFLEFRKGILFLRLNGVITKDTYQKYKDDVIDIIKNNGMRNVVINFKEIEDIDLKGINLLYYTYEIIKQNKGILYFTNINDSIIGRIEKSHILRYVKVLENELVSFDEIII